jgi:hypothetical protein
MLGYIPTQKLRNLITRVMTQIDLPWNPKRDTIYLDDGGLHWLSAPPDSTVNQYFGDTIVAQVGAGAQHVTIGKDIQVQAGGQDGDEG